MNFKLFYLSSVNQNQPILMLFCIPWARNVWHNLELGSSSIGSMKVTNSTTTTLVCQSIALPCHRANSFSRHYIPVFGVFTFQWLESVHKCFTETSCSVLLPFYALVRPVNQLVAFYMHLKSLFVSKSSILPTICDHLKYATSWHQPHMYWLHCQQMVGHICYIFLVSNLNPILACYLSFPQFPCLLEIICHKNQMHCFCVD